MLQTQSVFANYSYNLTQHLLLNLSSNFSRNQSTNSQSTGNPTNQFNRSYFTGSAGIAWQPAKNWQLKGSYVYNWQDYQQNTNVQNLINTGTSDSNAVMLFLGYSWDGIRNSR
jgi:opacity protein-like surface antigen